MPEPTWAAGLFREGGADELQDAERRVAMLKIELEAIRSGRKDASAAELRKLERDYRAAVAEVQQLRIAQAPRPTVTPTPSRVGAPRPAPRPVPTPGGTPVPPVAAPGRPPGALGGPTPRGYTARVGPPPTGGVGAAPGGVTTPRGYAGAPAAPAGRPMPPGYMPGGGAPAAGLWRPSGSAVAASERRTRGLGAGEMTYEDYLAQQRQMSDYEKAMMDWRNRSLAQEGRMTQYQMGQLGQGQTQMRATALYRQQQAEQAQAQLKQAWMIAQQELAHAQNVMASQIGTSLSQQQGQQWAQGLPYALPQGTSVAPGFERGGPVSQLYRMGGAQFTPGVTGRISPQPPPSFGKTMGWLQQAMGRFGSGAA